MTQEAAGAYGEWFSPAAKKLAEVLDDVHGYPPLDSLRKKRARLDGIPGWLRVIFETAWAKPSGCFFHANMQVRKDRGFVSFLRDSPFEASMNMIDLLLDAVEPTKKNPVKPLPPLTPNQRDVYNLIIKRGLVTGKDIIKETGIEQSTLTTSVIPELKKHGVRNRRGVGYYHPDHLHKAR